MLNVEKGVIIFFICYKVRLKYEFFKKLKNKLFMSYYILFKLRLKKYLKFEVLILLIFCIIMILFCKKVKVVIDF